MSRKLALCCIRQETRPNNLNLCNEVIERELESDFQELNGLRGMDLLSGQNSPRLSISNKNTNKEIMKPFWFIDVEVEESQNTVEVEFSDGHTETFQEAEVWTAYPTLKPDDYGPDFKGVYKNNTGTRHFVDSQDNIVCGRFSDFDPNTSDIIQLQTENDNLSYNIFCSQCSSKYDTLIKKAADLSISLDC